MGRPTKATVNYFPHVTEHGKTLFILQNIWGNDGYAAWFKILERLGASENHVLNMNDPSEFAYLAAYCKVQPETLTAILDQCSALNAINPGLWRKKLIYSQNFVDGVADAYRKRKEKLPTVEKIKTMFPEFFPEETEFPAEEIPQNEVSVVKNGEREREREIGKEKKEKDKKKNSANAPFVLPDWIPPDTWAAYMALRERKKAAKTTYALNLIVSELKRIKRIHNHDPVAVLNKSIKCGWIDVYPLKDYGGANANGNGSGNSRSGTGQTLAHAGRAKSDGNPWPEPTVYGPD